MAKSTDPFMAALWSAMLEEKLPPGGHETSWGVTSTRIRNRFTKAVRQAMQSGAAFSAIPLDKIPVYTTRATEEPTSKKGAKTKKKGR
jgi:trehalose utilization protein